MSTYRFDHVLDSLCSGRVKFFFPPETESAIQGSGDQFYSPERHIYTEMIYKIAGLNRIWVNGECFDFPDDEFWILTPGTIHSESFHGADSSYVMLWLSLLPQATIMHLSGYRTASGFFGPSNRVAHSTPFSEKLWEYTHNVSLLSDRIGQMRFQTLLIQMIWYLRDNPHKLVQDEESRHKQVVEQIQFYVDKYYYKELTLQELASMVYYSPGHLNVVFKNFAGVPVHKYLNNRRIVQAQEMLKENNMHIKEVASLVGFKDPLYFSRIFRQYTGVSPARFVEETRRGYKA